MGVVQMLKPKTTGVAWPWRLRHTQERDTVPSRCKFCERDAAKPREDDLAVCIYCALDRGFVPVEDKPF